MAIQLCCSKHSQPDATGGVGTFWLSFTLVVVCHSTIPTSQAPGVLSTVQWHGQSSQQAPVKAFDRPLVSSHKDLDTDFYLQLAYSLVAGLQTCNSKFWHLCCPHLLLPLLRLCLQVENGGAQGDMFPH